MKTNTKTFKLVFSALMVAMSFVLDIVSGVLPFHLPFGGDITLFSMVPIVVTAQLFGTGYGLLAGVVFGFIKMVMGLDNFGYVSGIIAYVVVFLFDYVMAYAMIGLSGLTRGIKNKVVAGGLGAFIGSMARFVCHFVSGCTVWREYANGFDAEAPSWIPSLLLSPKALPYTYSFTYNCIYMIPETILTVIGAAIICGALSKMYSAQELSA